MKAKPIPPCGKVCADRAAGCQATCERWKAYEVERAAYYEENQKRQAIIAIDAEMKIRQHEKIARKNRDRKRRRGR
jgi:hypothetical protein